MTAERPAIVPAVRITCQAMAAVLGIAGVLLGTASHAQQVTLGNLPPSTVIGRLGSSIGGPAQAIPFATLGPALSFSTLTMTPVAISALPACATANKGMVAFVSDTTASGAATFHGSVTAGGATTVNSLVSCNGSNWQYD